MCVGPSINVTRALPPQACKTYHLNHHEDSADYFAMRSSFEPEFCPYESGALI